MSGSDLKRSVISSTNVVLNCIGVTICHLIGSKDISVGIKLVCDTFFSILLIEVDCLGQR